jgi:geranylgeranyl pyrophosphate synthase
VGEDLREDKPTPLLVIARQRARGSDAKLLQRVGTAISDKDVDALRELFERTGTRQAVEQDIVRLTADALAGLDDSPMAAEVRAPLIELPDM